MKNWLIKNKIYFEIVVATLLAIMAVVVSISQFYIASQQTKLITAQLEVVKTQIEPNIQVREKLIKNYDEHQIYISNLGVSALDASSKTRVFLTAELHQKEAPHSFEIEIALDGYYKGATATSNHEGLMFTIVGDQNNKRMNKLRREFRKLSDKNGYYSSIGIRRYVRVSYTNILGKPKELYYYVKSTGSEQITNSQGSELFKKYNSLFGTPLSQELRKLNATTIFDLLRNTEINKPN